MRAVAPIVRQRLCRPRCSTLRRVRSPFSIRSHWSWKDKPRRSSSRRMCYCRLQVTSTPQICPFGATVWPASLVAVPHQGMPPAIKHWFEFGKTWPPGLRLSRPSRAIASSQESPDTASRHRFLNPDDDRILDGTTRVGYDRRPAVVTIKEPNALPTDDLIADCQIAIGSVRI